MPVGDYIVLYNLVSPGDVYQTHLPTIGEFEHPLDSPRWISQRTNLSNKNRLKATSYLGNRFRDLTNQLLTFDILALTHIDVNFRYFSGSRYAVIFERHHCAPSL